MSRRPPVTLWKHVTAELWRLLLLTVAVLVTVIAFAAAIKPLADGKLGPAEAIKFMVLAIPPMLAYALPFSAGFAATLAYHRMAQDNELLAAHSGGIAHRSLLAPSLATGFALFLTLASLNEYIIPHFLRAMERLVAQDLTKMMVNSIERGHAVEHNDLIVYADGAVTPGPETLAGLRGQGIDDAVALQGVVFVDTDKEGRIKNSVVTSRAEVYVIPASEAEGRDERVASIVVKDGMAWREDGMVVAVDEIPVAVPIPNAFRDDPKFQTWAELRALRDHPDRMDFVHTRSLDLAFVLARRASTSAISTDLETSGQTKLITRSGERFVVRAAGIRWDRELLRWVVEPRGETGGIEIEWWRADESGEPGSGGVTRLRPAEATLNAVISGQGAERALTITFDLRDVRVEESGAGLGGEDAPTPAGGHDRLTVEGLRMAYDPLEEYVGKEAYELLAIAEPRVHREDNPDAVLRRPTVELRREVDSLQREITSKQNERWALASACLIMVVTGAVTAVRLRDAQPLAVYLWSFFPALAAVITVMSGQQLTHESGAIGLVLLWSGVAGLGGYTFLTFLGIRKH